MKIFANIIDLSLPCGIAACNQWQNLVEMTVVMFQLCAVMRSTGSDQDVRRGDGQTRVAAASSQTSREVPDTVADVQTAQVRLQFSQFLFLRGATCAVPKFQ